MPSWRRADPKDYSLPSGPSTSHSGPAVGVGPASNGSESDPRVTAAARVDRCTAVPVAAATTTTAATAGGAHGGLPAAPLMILFSGGVDSVLLAALAHRVLPPEVPVGGCRLQTRLGTVGYRWAGSHGKTRHGAALE
jgi:hypothetical protein